MSDVKRFLAPTNDTCDMDSYQKVVLAADYDALLADLQHRDKLLEENRQAWDTALKGCELMRAERDQLRAELDAIRGQEPVAWVSPDAVGGTRWKAGALQQLNDGSPLYALPPQQPDAVSVPRELLVDLLCGLRITRDRAINEIRTLFLSTRQAEEDEPCAK